MGIYESIVDMFSEFKALVVGRAWSHTADRFHKWGKDTVNET